MKDEALKLADELEGYYWESEDEELTPSKLIRRLVEELDKKQQAIVEASGMLFNYKFELDLERAMSAQLKEELDKQEKSDANLHLTPLPEADRNLLDSNESISQHKAIMRKNAFNEYIPLFLGNDGLPEGTLLYTTPQTKPLSDDVLNKAFDYYCETDEGVLRFDYELRASWKRDQLKRWKEAFRKAWY